MRPRGTHPATGLETSTAMVNSRT